MFEWLREELTTIKTSRFHVVDGPADPTLAEAVAKSRLDLPACYERFVLLFGNAKLYRHSRCGYTVGVFASPRMANPRELAEMYQVGYHDSRGIYLGRTEQSKAWAIYAGGRGPAKRIAMDFDEWLVAACSAARGFYSPAEWARIVNGPPPFSEEEQQIIAARRNFEWRVQEIDPSGDRIILVSNTGDRCLRTLTIGVRSADGHLNGAVKLDVSQILPGQTTLLRAPCYKDIFDPEKVEVFSLPDPQPEDRPYYAELKDLSGKV